MQHDNWLDLYVTQYNDLLNDRVSNLQDWSGTPVHLHKKASFFSDCNPVIIKSPKNRKLEFGDVAVFNVEARGIGDLKYQWIKDGILLPGASMSTPVLQSVVNEWKKGMLRIRSTFLQLHKQLHTS